MKKEAVILVAVIAFLTGFVVGAFSFQYFLRNKDARTARSPQKPPMAPQEAAPPGPPPAELPQRLML